MSRRPELPAGEARALAQARRALERGRFESAALCYEAAARSRSRHRADPFDHLLQAAKLWSAAGKPGRALAACRRARPLAGRGASGRRAALHLARGDALRGLRRHRRAAVEFAAAQRLSARDAARAHEAVLGRAESLVSLGRNAGALALLRAELARVTRSGDVHARARTLYALGRARLAARDPLEALSSFSEAETLARGTGRVALAASAAASLAEARLGLGAHDDARLDAARAAGWFRELGDTARAAAADLVQAAAALAVAERYEAVAGPAAGAGHRRRAAELVRKALPRVPDGRRTLDGLRAAARPGGVERAALERGRDLLTQEAEPKAAALVQVLVARATFQGREEDLVRGEAGPRRDRAPTRAAAALPTLRPGEAAIVLCGWEDEIHAWAMGPERHSVSHVRLGSEVAWRTAARIFRQHAREASGWPDGVVPETFVRSARRALEHVAAQLWTPLLPALAGAAHVCIVPDPELPDLPWAGLALCAPPRIWPRVRAVSLLPCARISRPRSWRLPGRATLALAERSSEHPVAEREARAVTRVIGGEAVPIPALGTTGHDPRSALLARLRRAQLWHLAARLFVDADVPPLSWVDLRGGELALWHLRRSGVRLRLAVVPWSVLEPRPVPLVGRVVGRVGPEGARRLGTAGATPARRANGESGVGRALLAAGAERALVGLWPLEPGATAGVLGSFYAGLARGDPPAEALFTAQRRGSEEGLHPAAWAGFALWGWS